MNRRLISLVLSLLILSAAIPFAHALAERVIDEAGLMTQEEIAELDALAGSISSSTGLDIVILTADNMGGLSTSSYADHYYDSNGYSLPLLPEHLPFPK